MKNEDILVRFGKIGSDLIPTQCTGAGDDERLGIGIRRLEELSKLSESFPKNIEKWLCCMPLAVVCQSNPMAQ
jgi:hypothetical protein